MQLVRNESHTVSGGLRHHDAAILKARVAYACSSEAEVPL